MTPESVEIWFKVEKGRRRFPDRRLEELGQGPVRVGSFRWTHSILLKDLAVCDCGFLL